MIESNTDFVPYAPWLMYRTDGVELRIREDEPVWAFQEGYAHNREGNSERRWQVIILPRGNGLSSFWTDLGPAEDFLIPVDDAVYPSPAYHQPVAAEHSVAECREMAERDRMDDYAVQQLHTQTKQSDIIPRYFAQVEEQHRLIKNQSTFGPHVKIERNSFSPVGAKELIEKRQQ